MKILASVGDDCGPAWGEVWLKPEGKPRHRHLDAVVLLALAEERAGGGHRCTMTLGVDGWPRTFEAIPQGQAVTKNRLADLLFDEWKLWRKGEGLSEPRDYDPGEYWRDRHDVKKDFAERLEWARKQWRGGRKSPRKRQRP
jgi:hypothetical protein